MKHNAEPEHIEQRCLFDWAQKHEARLHELRCLFAVPNGRGRSKMEAAKLKAEGVKRGVPDVWLPVPRDGYHGLVCEMKAPGELNDVSEDQQKWHGELRNQGYLVLVADHWRSAWNVIVRYLGRPDLCLLVPSAFTRAAVTEFLDDREERQKESAR